MEEEVAQPVGVFRPWQAKPQNACAPGVLELGHFFLNREWGWIPLNAGPQLALCPDWAPRES